MEPLEHATQAETEVEPVEEAYFPDGQLEQLLKPELLEYLPAAQGVHKPAPAVENDPAEHSSVHTVFLPVCPEYVPPGYGEKHDDTTM
jgi:hypothetical protein